MRKELSELERQPDDWSAVVLADFVAKHPEVGTGSLVVATRILRVIHGRDAHATSSN